jgi:hypothetical protein
MDTEEIAERVLREHLERRQVPRFEVDEPGAMLLVAHGTRLACRILDLSLNGCRLFASEKLILGDSVRVELNFKVNGILFRFPGISRWTDGRNMFGIEFAAMSARRKDELAEIIEEIAAEIAATAARQAAEEEAARKQEAAEEAEQKLRLQQEKQRLLLEQELQGKLAEEQEGRDQAALEIQRKLAEKENQRRQAEREALLLAAQFRSAAAAPLLPEWIEPEAAAPEAPPEKPAPRDRRASARHEVDTGAVIHLINIASRQTGRIIDLSMGGCRIKTDERFPVGIYTRVETEFRLEGLPFRLGGVVQALHNGKIVGIRFLDMSLRKREQLEQLIVEIENSRAT